MVVKERQGRLGLKVVALLLATALWFIGYVDRTEDESQRVVEVPVSYIPPEAMIALEEVSSVELRVKGKTSAVTTFNPLMVNLMVDLRDKDPGPVEVTLTADNVALPKGLEVVSIEPSNLQLELDHVDSRQLPVQVDTTGEPAAGARFLGAQATPAEATVTGPRTFLEKHSFLVTEPVSLDTHAFTFEETVPIRSPNPLISVQPPRVRVRIDLQPPELPASTGNREDPRQALLPSAQRGSP
jgi:YbbR domain-containing protein